jgi:hypothetical protein
LSDALVGGGACVGSGYLVNPIDRFFS